MSEANIWQLIDRAESVLSRLESILPPTRPDTDWSARAFRWRRDRYGAGYLHPVHHPHQIRLADLVAVEPQKAEIDRNTRQFAGGRLANNVLLTGARGTGKSSLVKAAWLAYADQGLRLIEVEKADLVDLPDIIEQVANRPERFIVFCDDLSFEEGEPGYKALKSALDGSISGQSPRVLIYATSNRRHLLPEYFDENARTRHIDGEVHPADAVEEKVSLSERFGLWLTFYPFDQPAYLSAARYWLEQFGCVVWGQTEETAALQWALGRGGRSGRIAWQFARDYAGRQGGQA
ncbi:ATP-binding protein [Parachitinimonas caeni]|uniref:ATP-binding protein n=1 Tax=Parachitinimonas caeni TaxID=3031301 RepID=A0ABT7DVD2_9NEIS|nr:ATP-binding protein [Parachitinimonas caeni]MDK2123100.1 ATP-binding protein [Parachitinimonas caeni]